MPEAYTKRRRLFRPSMTFILIVINILMFLLVIILQQFYPNFDSYVALTPKFLVQGKYLWTLLTSMFVHANIEHLFFNMISLFFVGTLLEKLIGKRRFLWFYLASGLVAGLFFALLSGLFGQGIGAQIFGDPSIPGVGASGAIFGIVGVLTLLIPRSKVYLVVGPLIAIILESIFATLFPTSALINFLNLVITVYVFLSIFSILSFSPSLRKIALPIEMQFWVLPIVAIVPLIIIGLFVTLPIGNTAHIGGFFAGLIYGFYLKKKYKNKTKYLSRVFSRM